MTATGDFSRAKQLYNDALSRPPAERDAFLSEACGDDQELLREVKSLLGYEEAAEALMEAPAAEAATQKVAVVRGTRLGPYEIEDLLGAGGMGEVHRARDTRLGREVAVKVLPGHVAKDPEALARFRHETKTIASLSHPNICTLHDVGRERDVDYMVMERLEGETLRERLERGALAPARAAELAGQVCRGLAAAHACGIVHRDLKPENLFLTREGVKILDFGLARRTTAAEKAETATALTRPGTVLGTVDYLSPEQARGAEADERSDVFALGAVLYEMLSGRRGFRRDSNAETLAAILTEDPPQLASHVPPGLGRIVRRCLEKEPGDRFESARDVALSLEVASVEPASARWRIPSAPSWIGAAAVAAALAVAVLWTSEDPEPARPPLRVRPLTSEPGPEWCPALSPDGDSVAYVKDEGIYVQRIDGGEPLFIAEARSAGGTAAAPAWSPDGRHIAFFRHVETDSGETVGEVMVVPASGGPARHVTSRTPGGNDWGLCWSPDQRFLAFPDRSAPDEPAAIVLHSLETGERRRLTHPAGGRGDTLPRISPDGRTLAFARATSGANTDVYVVPVDGGAERRLTEGSFYLQGLDWSADGRSIVFASLRKGGAGQSSLWRVRLAGGAAELLPFGEEAQWPSISREGNRLAYTRLDLGRDVFRVGGPAASDDERSTVRLISSSVNECCPAYSPDGTQIAFQAWRSGAPEIWVSDSDGSHPRRLTFLDPVSGGAPVWSPDGLQIAFGAMEESEQQAYVVGVSGGLPRRLTGDSDGVPAAWSRDGAHVYFSSLRSGRRELWKVPREGGEAVQITRQGGGTTAQESPDGRHLYFSRKDRWGAGAPGLWRVPVDGGEETLALAEVASSRWTLFGETQVLYLEQRSSPHRLQLFDLVTGEMTWSATLDALAYLEPPSISPDGRFVLYAGTDRVEADIVLVEDFH